MSNQLVPVNDIRAMADAVAKSGLFGMKTPEQAMSLMLVAQSENLHPARAAMEYHIINGRPALKADAMLSRFQNAGGKVEWKKYTDEECIGVFSHPQGGSIEIEWTLAMAQKAGLTNNPTWKKFSRAMLRSRCISEGIRTIYPGVSVGIYTPEEVQDFVREEKDITPVPTQEKVAKPKPALSKPKPEETITGDPSEGDLSQVAPIKPKQEDVDKMLAAFAKLDMDIETVGKEYGKPVAEWTIEDMTEAREWYKARKTDWELRQVEMKSTKEEVI